MEWKWLNEPKKATDSSRLIRCEVQVRMLLDEVLQSTHLSVPGNANDLWYGKSNIEVQRGLGVGNNIISARLSAYMSYPAMFTSIHIDAHQRCTTVSQLQILQSANPHTSSGLE